MRQIVQMGFFGEWEDFDPNVNTISEFARMQKYSRQRFMTPFQRGDWKRWPRGASRYRIRQSTLYAPSKRYAGRLRHSLVRNTYSANGVKALKTALL